MVLYLAEEKISVFESNAFITATPILNNTDAALLYYHLQIVFIAQDGATKISFRFLPPPRMPDQSGRIFRKPKHTRSKYSLLP